MNIPTQINSLQVNSSAHLSVRQIEEIMNMGKQEERKEEKKTD
jgi:hypothetical protein